jgi:hypothetical protein
VITRLLPISVGGYGTAEIESLPSYVHRLAYHHGIYVGELLRFVVRQLERDKNYVSTVAKLPSYIHPEDILRKNKLADSLVAMLEYITRQGLCGTTVSIFNDPLTISRNELYKGFRWCPECISEMIKIKEDPYFKLIWQFRAIIACPVHRTPLIQCCEHCGCDQTTYVKRCSLGFCQSCGIALSLRKTRLKSKDIASSWQDIGRDVVELLSDLLVNGGDYIVREGLLISVEELFNEFWSQGRENELYQFLNRDLLLAVIHHKKSLCLNDIRKLSFGLGVSLYDLMSGNAAKNTKVLITTGFCPFPPSFLEVSVRVKRDHRAILRKLQNQISNNSAPLSLREISRRLNVSTGYLRYRYPLQVRMISERYSDFCKEHKRRIRCQAQEAALRYFTEDLGDAPKSRKQAYLKIREETGIAKFVLKDAINVVYSNLHCK